MGSEQNSASPGDMGVELESEESDLDLDMEGKELRSLFWVNER